MTTLDDVILIFAAVGQGLSGIKSAPDYPPEKAGDFPFWVVYPPRFTSTQTPQGSMTTLYDIACGFHIGRKGTLSNEVEFLLGYPETIMESLFEACNANLLAHETIEGTFGPLGWDDTPTIGFLFTIRNVKIVTDFT